MRDRLSDERYQVLVSLVVFALPGIVSAGTGISHVPTAITRSLPLFVVLGPVLYWGLTTQAGTAARTGLRTDEREPAAETDTEEDDPTDRARADLIAVNYEQLSEQAKYRDKLLINANYFSLAIIAVLVNVFLRADVELRPLIAVVGAVTAYAFWLAAESYKGSRDELNGELREIEAGEYEELSVVQTYDLRDRSPIEKRSLSSYLIGLQATAVFLWWGAYLFAIVYIGYY
ncbi:hypothetical protein ACFO5R_13025 [Halosolutus amylolyticus]|uniref:Uncharacterized protein n=1 Tax=Halosolutus amylolyticus TaxID=2932267 RepID=A0ABD5PQM6_9EURY|nr:hypothetical protein [Halosolutus amylolyticus]